MSVQTTQAEANYALVAALYDGIAAGDIESVMARLSQDVVVREPGFLPYGGSYRGVEEFLGLMPRLTERLDFARLKVERLLASDERVVAIVRLPDRRTGGDIVAAEESRIVDGKVAEITVYFHDAQSLLT